MTEKVRVKPKPNTITMNTIIEKLKPKNNDLKKPNLKEPDLYIVTAMKNNVGGINYTCLSLIYNALRSCCLGLSDQDVVGLAKAVDNSTAPQKTPITKPVNKDMATTIAYKGNDYVKMDNCYCGSKLLFEIQKQ